MLLTVIAFVSPNYVLAYGESPVTSWDPDTFGNECMKYEFNVKTSDGGTDTFKAHLSSKTSSFTCELYVDPAGAPGIKIETTDFKHWKISFGETGQNGEADSNNPNLIFADFADVKAKVRDYYLKAEDEKSQSADETPAGITLFGSAGTHGGGNRSGNTENIKASEPESD